MIIFKTAITRREMEQRMTEEQLREMAYQLSCPQGERGLETGKIMNEVNIGITTAAIDTLEITDGNKVLELDTATADIWIISFNRLQQNEERIKV